MKKVLLTKSQHIQPVVAGGSDLLLSRQAAVVRVSIPAPLGTTTYIQRKSFQPVYEDIFKLLMRIPDKALVQRVIDAMNGHNNSDKIAISYQGKQCSCGAQKVDASTQTEMEPEEKPIKSIEKPAIKNESSESTGNTTTTQESSSSTPVESLLEPIKVPKKRGRKRNTCVPQVVKRSAAEMALQEREEKQLTPVVTKKKKQDVSVSKTMYFMVNYSGLKIFSQKS